MDLRQIAAQMLGVIYNAERRLCHIVFQPLTIQIIRGKKGNEGYLYFRYEYSPSEFNLQAKQYIFEALRFCGIGQLAKEYQEKVWLYLLDDVPFELVFRLQRCIQIVALSGL